MQRAAEIAPRIWTFPASIAPYAFAIGDAEREQAAYAQAAQTNPDLVLNWRGVQDEAIQAAIVGLDPVSDIARTLNLLARGQAEDARAFWLATSSAAGNASPVYVVSALVARANGDESAAAHLLEQARRAASGFADDAWLYAAEFCLTNDAAARQRAFEAAQAALNIGPLAADWPLGANILYIQFLRLGIPRQFLPQVGYLDVEPTLYYLLSQDGVLCAR
jgi:hypothetical protein